MSTLVAKTTTYLTGFSASDWASDNRVLQPYEITINSDDLRQKQGDGVTVWSSLPYIDETPNYSTTATAAGTTTLTARSNKEQFFTGVTTQTVLLPVTSTLKLGQQFLVFNKSTGVVTVQSSGANTIQAVAPGGRLLVTCVSLSGTGTASWGWTYTPDSSGNTLLLTGAASQLGFGTGAGGAITQITNSATGVTINTSTGQITTVALTTAAGAEERFTVTNSSVAATDIPVVSTTYNGAGTVGLSVQKVGAGVFDIVITNLHASAAFNAAMVINFAVIKGVAA